MICTRVLLINAMSDYIKEKAAIPLGLLSIATYLADRGHVVEIYDRAVEGGNIKKRFDNFSPDIVGISSLGGRSFDDAMKVSKTAKKSQIPVVWGGPIPSLIPDVLLKSGVVDYVIMGEGEITLLELINALAGKTPLTGVDGLTFINNGEIVINKDREFADLANLPIIDFSFVDPEKYFISNMNYKRILFVYASKGCTGQCAYCYSPVYTKCIWRPRPTEYVLSEIKFLADRFNIEGVYFADDLFSPNKQYLFNLCEKLIQSGLGLVWSCDMRADICTKDELDMMYKAGCRWIFFGIESGSAERQKAIKKRINLKKAEEVIDYCNKIGIITTTSFIIGFPDETEEELKQTVSFIKGLNSDVKVAAFFGPIAKSEMYYELVENKRLTPPKTYIEWKKFVWMDKLGINFSNVPSRDLKVISSCFFMSIFKNEHGKGDSKERIWIKRLFGQALDILKRKNLMSILIIFLSIKEMLEIIFYSVMYPKIRKKYGLKSGSGKTVKND